MPVKIVVLDRLVLEDDVVHEYLDVRERGEERATSVTPVGSPPLMAIVPPDAKCAATLAGSWLHPRPCNCARARAHGFDQVPPSLLRRETRYRFWRHRDPLARTTERATGALPKQITRDGAFMEPRGCNQWQPIALGRP